MYSIVQLFIYYNKRNITLLELLELLVLLMLLIFTYYKITPNC
jgi:hypothetical protein